MVFWLKFQREEGCALNRDLARGGFGAVDGDS
jgi:hypothetical protein